MEIDEREGERGVCMPENRLAGWKSEARHHHSYRNASDIPIRMVVPSKLDRSTIPIRMEVPFL